MKPRRPALRYHGGKWKLAKWIISYFPEHRIYTEAFAGAFSVGLQKPTCYCEVYNDRWDLVVNVFQVLRDPDLSQQLKSALELTPFSRSEFDHCGDLEIAQLSDPVEKARRTIFRSFAGFGSAATNAKHSTGFRAKSNRSGTTPAHDWKNYPKEISSFVNRLRGVVIENRNAVDVLTQHDTPETLHYVDPPYPHSTRNMKRGNAAYAFEMSDDDHRELAAVLHSLEGMVILSGYPCELYDEELFPDWERVTQDTFADGARERKEVLWLNPATTAARNKLTLFNCA